MAAKSIAQAQKDSADLNMTPMIDCVFQLIIFFMVVTEIKKSDDADVQLPRTRYVEPEPAHALNRVVVNCTWRAGDAVGGVGSGQGGGTQAVDGIEVRHRRMEGPALEAYLAKLDRENRIATGPAVTGTTPGPSQLYVKIRADARCAWRTVQTAQLACMKAGIFQVSYGAEKAQRRR